MDSLISLGVLVAVGWSPCSVLPTFRPAAQRLEDRVSAVPVPVVIALAVATFAGRFLVDGSVTASFIAATATLIIACPCSLRPPDRPRRWWTPGVAAARSLDRWRRWARCSWWNRSSTLTSWAPVLHEQPTWATALGGLVVAFAVALAVRTRLASGRDR